MTQQRPPLSAEQQRLAAAHLPLARKLARPFQARYPHLRDELESAAHFALVEAAQGFLANRGAKFSTFAFHRIRGALKDIRREDERHSVEPLPSLEIVDARDPGYAAIDAADSLTALTDRLSCRRQEIIRLVFVEGLSILAASHRLGVTPTWGLTLYRTALSALESPARRLTA